MQSRIVMAIVAGVVAGMVSCTRQREPAAEQTSACQIYSVTGVVMSLRPRENEVVIKHQKIPGYMEAMTMPFSTHNANELAALVPGEEIRFKMIVTDEDAWIEQIKKTGRVENILPQGAPIRIAREVEPLEVGDTLPEYHFVNELGQNVSLSQFKGNALVISFLFTRCPLPKFCPLTAKKLAKAQDQLVANLDGPTNWHFLAITIDPEFDTPERLKQFGELYGYQPDRWSFLTGELIDITAIAEQFGLFFWTEDGVVKHNLRTVVVGADGFVRTNIIGNEWEVDALVKAVNRAATLKR